jgi:hypothetical protein
MMIRPLREIAMAVSRRLRLVKANNGPYKPEKPLPKCDYSGDLTDEQIAEIRARVEPEIKSGKWKTIDGPAW